MQAFITEAENRPGELARHADAIAARGINLASVVCLAIGNRGAAAFIAADEAGLRAALTDAGIGYRELALVTAGIEDQPGTVAGVARKLSEAGVNIDLLAPVGMTGGKVIVAVGVDRPDEARRALGDLVTEWSATATGAATA